jgi:hypothetical protein
MAAERAQEQGWGWFTCPSHLTLVQHRGRGAMKGQEQSPWLGTRHKDFPQIMPLSSSETVITESLPDDFSTMSADSLLLSLFLSCLPTFQALTKAFRRKIPTPVETFVTRWGSDPFSRGSYSNYVVGNLRNITGAPDAKTPQKNVMFSYRCDVVMQGSMLFKTVIGDRWTCHG